MKKALRPTRTHEVVSDEGHLVKNGKTTVPVEHGIASYKESESASRFDPNPGEYWDPVSDTYRSKSEINKDDEVWTPMVKSDSNNGTKGDNQKETTIGYGRRSDEKSNSLATREDLVQKTNINTKRTFRLRKDFLTKVIILSLAIGRCVTAKNIDGLTVENEIKQGNSVNKYHIEKSSKDLINEKIDEESIQAFDCEEESMANAEISLNPPAECNREDGSAYRKPVMKRAQVLEKVKRIPVNITTCMIHWRVNVGRCGGEFAIESCMHKP